VSTREAKAEIEAGRGARSQNLKSEVRNRRSGANDLDRGGDFWVVRWAVRQKRQRAGALPPSPRRLWRDKPGRCRAVPRGDAVCELEFVAGDDCASGRLSDQNPGKIGVPEAKTRSKCHFYFLTPFSPNKHRHLVSLGSEKRSKSRYRVTRFSLLGNEIFQKNVEL